MSQRLHIGATYETLYDCVLDETAEDKGRCAPAPCSATVTARDGLLWCNGKMIPLPEADRVALQHGYQYAEQLVRALEAKSPN